MVVTGGRVCILKLHGDERPKAPNTYRSWRLQSLWPVLPYMSVACFSNAPSCMLRVVLVLSYHPAESGFATPRACSSSCRLLQSRPCHLLESSSRHECRGWSLMPSASLVALDAKGRRLAKDLGTAAKPLSVAIASNVKTDGDRSASSGLSRSPCLYLRQLPIFHPLHPCQSSPHRPHLRLPLPPGQPQWLLRQASLDTSVFGRPARAYALMQRRYMRICATSISVASRPTTCV